MVLRSASERPTADSETMPRYQPKQDLAHIKAQWVLFQQIGPPIPDTKDLDNIPRYSLSAQRLALPALQHPREMFAADCSSRALPEGRSASSSAVFAARIWQHVDRYGVLLPRSGLAD
jgi:hypothetical protein